MTIPKAFITIAACVVAFAAGGLGIGGLIGVISPDYYGVIFDRANDIDAVEFGLAIGLAQGATFGLFAGLVSIIAVTWYRVRVDSKRPTPA